ncbi:hypothetical protein ACTXT7_012675 [Hymenolepis weldensis]
MQVRVSASASVLTNEVASLAYFQFFNCNVLTAYSIEPLGDFHWVLTSLSIQVLYHFLFLQPMGMLSHANLNQMLCPALSDPFAGPYYRIAAMIHQPILILIIGKLYSIVALWLQQGIKSPNFIKPLISSFHWLPGLAIILGNPDKATPHPIVCEKTGERRPRSLEELFQTQRSCCESVEECCQ